MNKEQLIVNLGMTFSNLDRLNCEDILLDDIYYDVAHTIKALVEDDIDIIMNNNQLIGIYKRAIKEIEIQDC